MYREAKRGLALLTALLMVFSGSVSAFAGTSGTETVAASETAGDQTVTLPGMKATGDEESIALDVSAYDGTTAEVTVEGDVILETPEGEVVYINAEEASEVTLDVTGFVTGETDGYVIGVETQGSGSADVNVDISISVDSETGLATGIHDSGDSDLSMKVGYDVNAEGETGAFGIVSSGSGVQKGDR